MSTRRARIKAVTALPPRRKNSDNNDNKTKPKPAINDAEKTKSPRTPQAVQQQLSGQSPFKVVASPLRVKTPVTVLNVPTDEREITLVAHRKTSVITTPEKAEKVSVITSTSSVKSVFLSPQVRSSPQRKVAQFTPKLELERKQTNVTPERNKNVNCIGRENVGKTVTPNPVSLSIENRNKDDYNVPSVPESVTEDTVMDGIIPLQAADNAPKPIALLKNEIISENAEVLFDPIVPLPSPSKVRPKLRPVPRLGPLRRNSVQGSASESEDESRRALLNSGAITATATAARQRNDSQTSHSTLHSFPNKELNRVRNDSVCSSMSQVTAPAIIAGSPVKEKHYTKSRKQDMSRRTAAMRRRRETVKRDALTMYDLIFYNPTTKPIVPDEDEIKAKEATELDIKQAEKEEEADDPPPKDAAPVPQMKLGPNGEIVLDETSLVIKNTANRQVSGVVREGAWSNTSGYYRRNSRTADWSHEETVRFYRALAGLGTDFTMMVQLFPGRTRQDLKKKFKKEERINGAQVDRALKAGNLWDVSKLNEEFVAERENAEKAMKEQKERLIREKIAEKERQQVVRENKIKECRGSRMLGSSAVPAKYHKMNEPATADDILDHVKRQRAMKKSAIQQNQTRPQTPRVKILNNISLSRNNSEIQIAIDGRGVNSNTKDRAPRISGNTELRDFRTPNHDITSAIPKNIETGSLVVLTVEDPNAPTKKILQTYISNEKGALTPVSLPSHLLNSVVGYMNKGTPKSNISVASSPLTSPYSVTSQDGRNTPNVIQGNAVSPAKRKRHSSYTITQL